MIVLPRRTLLRWLTAMALCLAALCGAAQAQQNDETGMQLAAQERPGILETVRGILGYVRWPGDPNPIRLCVLGSNAPAAKLLAASMADLGERKVQMLQPTSEIGIGQRCDAVFVAANSALSWRKVLEQISGQPVLSLCERSPACTTGSMFYLDISPQDHVQFEVDIDAVARSSVRVNPQVLRLGRRPGGRTS
ncbi:YfiR family protein [Variovorax sp. HJSM1_2]|uniref:YfiR family protein n=1 Tax=Variovorax sp. HJSM1_2 TaxID=3366263 RepID=UPI003BC98967